MRLLLKISFLFIFCFNLKAQQISDEVYRNVSLQAFSFLLDCKNINPIDGGYPNEEFKNLFSIDAKIINDIPSLNLYPKSYTNNNKISPNEYIDSIGDYDYNTIWFDFYIKEMSDVYLVDNDSMIDVYVTKRNKKWRLNNNEYQLPIQFSDELDLKITLNLKLKKPYLTSSIDLLRKKIKNYKVNEDYDALKINELNLEIYEMEGDIADLIEKGTQNSSYYFEISDIGLADSEGSKFFGYSDKKNGENYKYGLIVIAPQIKEKGIFGNFTTQKIDLKINSDTITGQKFYTRAINKSDKSFVIEAVDGKYFGKTKIDVRNPKNNKKLVPKKLDGKDNQYGVIPIKLRYAIGSVSLNYKSSLSPIRIPSDFNVQKINANNSQELMFSFNMNNILPILISDFNNKEFSNKWNLFLNIGLEKGVYNHQITKDFYQEFEGTGYPANDFSDREYTRFVTLSNIVENQSFEIEKITLPELELSYIFDKKYSFFGIRPTISFSVGLNNFKLKSATYNSEAIGEYGGNLSPEYFDVEIDENNGVHNFGVYQIFSSSENLLYPEDEIFSSLQYGFDIGLEKNSFAIKFGCDFSSYTDPLFLSSTQDGQPKLSDNFNQLESLNNLILLKGNDEMRFFSFNFGINYKF